ncbi:uroporphyrinogen-III C-methyltransferase [Agromyces albus]|uniref:uroporphyrinogen-III C-methyltransferase n=1 Tax=Agromyces albus TaxID=205332 RepID=UPI00277DED1D|nr:uroporphyrinogen-III C-methyltransferase [Agromyces albus]MDQ0575694.1 uroporphyrin-III C-methyltransferase/precorrin-2 dehydrogenase/sirohydrochlorin ferrochelatase [Agromyces albus]
MLIGIDVTGRRVVAVGGGPVSARRVARFVDEGAEVVVVAPELDPALAVLVDEDRITWTARPVVRDDLADAWLVHTATGVPAVDHAVAAWADEARIFCVNAGHGDHGTARMTAETRSGDLIVGVVSEGGVDPRRSGAVRDAVADALAEGRLPVRRRRTGGPGRVVLVGGGPGAADLITLRGRRALAEADVVVTDRLGPRALLAELEPGVEIVDVGKAPGRHPVPQHEINRILVERALAGQHVVRLKGGDPFVFGRGGEEVAACLDAGVAVEVVPGISSAISVPQAAGIPVTHRGTAASMLLVNGHDDPTKATLAALADDTTTTVVLMGVERLGGFAEAAIAAGAPHDRPVAIVESGTTSSQRTTRATLGTVAAAAAAAGVQAPAVIVVGEVAAAGLLTRLSDPARSRTG